MRYNPPVERTNAEIQSWVGQTARDTHGQVGTVVLAWREAGNVVGLKLADKFGVWLTDSEHATIVRDVDQEG